MSKKMKIKSALFFIGFLLAPSAKAELEILPVSRHQQSMTYGLFTDQQTTLIFRSEGRAWGAVGGAIALLEERDWKWQPQLIAHGLASASFRINPSGDMLLTDTVDARAGMGLDFKFSNDFRGSILWTHQSGHISDNVPEMDLIGSNLGNEVLSFRLIKDIDQTFRFGGSFRPFVGSEPAMKFFGADQFGEWFFNGASSDMHHFAPFLAMGVEEYGLNHIDTTFHVQVGFMAGNHFSETKYSSLRTVLGYYTGVDPRLKYYEFKNRKTSFLYAGLMIDL